MFSNSNESKNKKTKIKKSNIKKLFNNQKSKNRILERPIWATFRGTIHDVFHYSFGVRQGLRTLSKTYPQLQIYEGHSPDYFKELSQTTFSLCPSGWSPWSPRFFDRLNFISKFSL